MERYKDYYVGRREVIFAVHQIVSKIKHKDRTEVREAFLHAAKLYEQYVSDLIISKEKKEQLKKQQL